MQWEALKVFSRGIKLPDYIFTKITLLYQQLYALKTEIREFPGGPVVDSVLPMQGAWVRSPVGELRFHMPVQPKQTNKQNKKIKNNNRNQQN